MAPSPEYDKEPKAPDKSATNISCEDPKLLNNFANDQHNTSDHTSTTNSTGEFPAENNKHVETLDDERLRALLDEAITYKCPKDREGKSSLFKELLEEVEQDEQACEAAARVAAGGRAWRRGARGPRRTLQHSNSLQDLVAALAAEPAPRKHHQRHHAHHHHAAAPTVSARAIHGGSLPSGVDTSSLLSEEGGAGAARGAGYLATVRCVNPPPLAERRVSASDANAPHELDVLNRRSKPSFPMTYTARATLEIGSGSVCSGRAVTTTTASNQVDAGIPFSCITTPEVVASCNTTSSTAHATVALDNKPLQLCSSYRAVASVTGDEPAAAPPDRALQPRSVIASSFNGLPLSRPNYGSTNTTTNDEFKKSLDENGNAVQGYSSPLSGSSQHKKPRRKKSSKNETVIDCRQLDGYQGDKDVNELLRFIESNAESRVPKLRAKHKDDSDDKSGKKRSAERRKDKEKVKRASSLEELSRTKLEDLTARPAPAPAKPERRSWGDAAPDDHEHSDFQTVTKKRKPRRRADDPPRRAPPAPPSDRSNDSNDDMDSVHSLPEPRPAPPAPPPPPPPPAPAHASYADIARTGNIPDLIESCNYYAEGEDGPHPPAAPPDADRPGADPADPAAAPAALAARHARDYAKQAAARRERKERAAPAPAAPPPADCPAPDVVADRRPPVILLDSASRPRDMDGVTFGFDINEQLLGGGARRPRCDLLRDALEAAGGAPGVAVRAGCAALRYVPPAAPPPRPHVLQIVEYVAGAWEDVLRCGAGKVRYYSE